MNIKYFDIISYLDDKDIQYWDSGENVSKGWINIECPFCPDHKNHCGINLTTKLFNCWICGTKGPAQYLVSRLESCSNDRAEKIIRKYLTDDTIDIQYEQEEYEQEEIKNIMPVEATKKFPRLHHNFLQDRNFDPDFIIKKFNLMACNNIGHWKFRIVAPITINRQIVTFQTRDVTQREGVVPYLPLPNNQSIIPIKHTLYNIDNVKKDRVLIVEGITDVWRFGDNVIGTMGYNFTQAQIKLLGSKKINATFVLFDAEEQAQKRAKELLSCLNTFVNHCERLELDKGDPADMKQSEADLLKIDLEL